jgi:dTMP kinase
VSGKLIVLEGVDGAGTTTQAARLGDAIRKHGMLAHVTREPSDGPVGKLIRQLLRGGVHSADQAMMTLLFAGDRLDHVTREIAPRLQSGTHVVCDRYVLSSEAYQTRFVDAEFVRQVNARARPADLTLLLDVDAEVAAQRRGARGGTPEMYEQARLQEAIVAHYRDAIPEAVAKRERLVRVDGSGTPDAVFAEIWRQVEICLGERGGTE